MMLRPIHSWNIRKLSGLSALLSGSMVLAALPLGRMAGSPTLVTTLLFDSPLLLLPAMFVVYQLVRPGRGGARRSVLCAGLVGWGVLALDTLVYDVIPLLGFATDAWVNRELVVLLPIRNGLIFAGIGGWMLGCGMLWRRADLALPIALGWLNIVTGSLWVVLGMMSWGLIGITGRLLDLPPPLNMAFQLLFVVTLLLYVVWAVGFGFWLQEPLDTQTHQPLR
jgi:hypothetical protein